MKTLAKLEAKGYKVTFSMQDSRVCFVNGQKFKNITEAYKSLN